MTPSKSFFTVHSYRVASERTRVGRSLARAEVEITIGGRTVKRAAVGVGPVHALDEALRACLVKHLPEVGRIRLVDYKVGVVEAERGTSAAVEVLIRATDGTDSWDAGCVSENIIDASFEALCSSAIMGLMRTDVAARPA